MLRTNTCGELKKKNAGEKVILSGWVESHRIQGRISFILLRDRYGITQIFVNPKLTKNLGEIRRETVLQIKGEVQARPENQINKEFSTGEIEVAAEKLNEFRDRCQSLKTEKGLHPTQKPIALLEYLIKTYTYENETVLDFTMGSGSTMIACQNTNRNGIGIEMDENYFNIANERINKIILK